MAHIIALQGPRNCGKTATLKMLVGMIQSEYPQASQRVIRPSRGRDIAVVFHNVNGKTIGIDTRGDVSDQLRESLTDLIAYNCDIILCACLSKEEGTSSTESVVKDVAQAHQYIVHFESKKALDGDYNAESYAAENREDATKLMYLLSTHLPQDFMAEKLRLLQFFKKGIMPVGQWVGRLSSLVKSSACRLWEWLLGDGLVIPVLATVGLVGLVYRNWDWVLCNSDIVRNLALIVLGVVGLHLAVWRSQVAHKQVQTLERSFLNERYQKGAEMLGSDTMSTRLGGIYALGRLAREYPEEYHIQIMDLFLEFLRHPPKDAKETQDALSKADEEARGRNEIGVSPDVQAIMSAIGSRSGRQVEIEGQEGRVIDLDRVNLSGINLKGGNLRGASLIGTNLAWADLSGVDFTGANIVNVDISWAKFWSVKGVSQAMLDRVVFICEDTIPPILHESYCVQTRELLVWRGKVRPRPAPEE